MSEFILERNLTDVTSMAKPSQGVQTLLNIRKYILERNRINVTYVTKHLVRIQALQFIKEFILGRSLTNVVNVVKPLSRYAYILRNVDLLYFQELNREQIQFL
ncbi:Zinc finger protein 826 [Pteropus alecto]|uniref:Zinc finger protein 826 n=1 Tax=Pteropus alecto TaxID=9402 RepID=L5L3G2_PTEAL|nr:Zinc finger protein 826 [Pteropus alecto]